MLLNVGVGCDGRQEIVDAVKGYLQEHFERRHSAGEILCGLSPDANAKYLYRYDFPDPALNIRTSGEVRCPVSCCGNASTVRIISATCIGQLSGG
jgi:undecaprenyl pyrophosphate synthase